jgi:3-isopropylmalate dehydrogenase
MTTRSLFLLPGDGIGPEAMAEVRKLIAHMNDKEGAGFTTDEGLVGGSAYDAHGQAISDEDMAKAMAADAVLFGAVGGPKWDSVPYEVRPEAGLLRLRKDMELFANLRPAICYPALAASSSLKPELVEGLDILIVRELTGGVYFGEPKEIIDLGNGQKRGIDTQVYDTFEIERIAGVAFELARTRGNKVCSMEKHNVMKSGVLWKDVVADTHKAKYSDVELTHMLADAGGMQLVRWPKQFDVIVTDNLFGDMLSDVAAMLTGSLGMLPSASLGAPDAGFRQAQGALRAGARLSAGHCGPGDRQSDRHDRVLCHVPALFLQHDRRSRPAGKGDFGGSRQRPAHRRHHVGRLHQGDDFADGRRRA